MSTADLTDGVRAPSPMHHGGVVRSVLMTAVCTSTWDSLTRASVTGHVGLHYTADTAHRDRIFTTECRPHRR